MPKPISRIAAPSARRRVEIDRRARRERRCGHHRLVDSAAGRSRRAPGAARSCGCARRARRRGDACSSPAMRYEPINRWSATTGRPSSTCAACGRRGRPRARPRPPSSSRWPSAPGSRVGDGGVHQHAVATQFHGDRRIRRGADAGIDQHRHLRVVDDQAQVPRD
jgi:hypothetical protein